MKKEEEVSPQTHSRDYQKNKKVFFILQKFVRNLFFVKQILEQEGKKGRKKVFMRNSPMNKSFHSAFMFAANFFF